MAVDTPARIAIIGSGPIGLEAALYARYLGYDVDVYERGQLAGNVRAWGHARLFTPFEMNRSPLGLAALKAQDPGWSRPSDESLLTGNEFIDRYLRPLAQSDLLADCIHEHCEVVAIGRPSGPNHGIGDARDSAASLDATSEPDEQEESSDARSAHSARFRLLVCTKDPVGAPRERVAEADVVIDASGTYGNHQRLGPGSVPAIGELAAASHFEPALPNVLGDQRARYAGRNVLVVGSDTLAADNVVALAELARQCPDTWITWVSAASSPQDLWNDQTPDAPAIRQKTFKAARQLAADDSNHVSFLGATDIEAIAWHADLDQFSVTLAGRHAGTMTVDRVIANSGFRPDTELTRELGVALFPATESIPGLAPMLTQTEWHGRFPARLDPAWLVTSVENFYVLGAKSYGRDGRFLIADGLDQIRALFTIIGGRASLDLYATMTGLY